MATTGDLYVLKEDLRSPSSLVLTTSSSLLTKGDTMRVIVGDLLSPTQSDDQRSTQIGCNAFFRVFTIKIVSPGRKGRYVTRWFEGDKEISSLPPGCIVLAGDSLVKITGFTINGCTDNTYSTFTPDATTNVAARCENHYWGCTDPKADNFNPNFYQRGVIDLRDQNLANPHNSLLTNNTYKYNNVDYYDANTPGGYCISKGTQNPAANSPEPEIWLQTSPAGSGCTGQVNVEVQYLNCSSLYATDIQWVVTNPSGGTTTYNNDSSLLSYVADLSSTAFTVGNWQVAVTVTMVNYGEDATTAGGNLADVVLTAGQSIIVNASVSGCMDPDANNFNPDATCPDGSCTFPRIGCMDDGTVPAYPGMAFNLGSALNYDAINNEHQQDMCVYHACSDKGLPYNTASNWIDNATWDPINGTLIHNPDSCIYTTEGAVYGCTDSAAYNYHHTGNTNFNFTSNATIDDGSCYDVTFGCLDVYASNFNNGQPWSNDPAQNVNTHQYSLCIYNGCADANATNTNEVPNLAQTIVQYQPTWDTWSWGASQTAVGPYPNVTTANQTINNFTYNPSVMGVEHMVGGVYGIGWIADLSYTGNYVGSNLDGSGNTLIAGPYFEGVDGIGSANMGNYGVAINSAGMEYSSGNPGVDDWRLPTCEELAIIDQEIGIASGNNIPGYNLGLYYCLPEADLDIDGTPWYGSSFMFPEITNTLEAIDVMHVYLMDQGPDVYGATPGVAYSLLEYFNIMNDFLGGIYNDSTGFLYSGLHQLIVGRAIFVREVTIIEEQLTDHYSWINITGTVVTPSVTAFNDFCEYSVLYPENACYESQDIYPPSTIRVEGAVINTSNDDKSITFNNYSELVNTAGVCCLGTDAGTNAYELNYVELRSSDTTLQSTTVTAFNQVTRERVPVQVIDLDHHILHLGQHGDHLALQSWAIDRLKVGGSYTTDTTTSIHDSSISTVVDELSAAGWSGTLTKNYEWYFRVVSPKEDPKIGLTLSPQWTNPLAFAHLQDPDGGYTFPELEALTAGSNVSQSGNLQYHPLYRLFNLPGIKQVKAYFMSSAINPTSVSNILGESELVSGTHPTQKFDFPIGYHPQANAEGKVTGSALTTDSGGGSIDCSSDSPAEEGAFIVYKVVLETDDSAAIHWPETCFNYEIDFLDVFQGPVVGCQTQYATDSSHPTLDTTTPANGILDSVLHENYNPYANILKVPIPPISTVIDNASFLAYAAAGGCYHFACTDRLYLEYDASATAIDPSSFGDIEPNIGEIWEGGRVFKISEVPESVSGTSTYTVQVYIISETDAYYVNASNVDTYTTDYYNARGVAAGWTGGGYADWQLPNLEEITDANSALETALTLNYSGQNVSDYDYWQGGYVLYRDTVNNKVYILSPDELNPTDWGCSGTNITSAEGVNHIDSVANTTAILSGCATAGIAARLCDEYSVTDETTGVVYDDWVLPSKNLLQLVEARKENFNALEDCEDLVYGSSTLYWSSSEGSTQASQAFTVDMNTDTSNVASTAKTTTARVRAIRVVDLQTMPIDLPDANTYWLDADVNGTNIQTVTNLNSGFQVTSSAITANNYIRLIRKITRTYGQNNSTYCKTLNTEGCTDPIAINYDSTALSDDGSCKYDITVENVDCVYTPPTISNVSPSNYFWFPQGIINGTTGVVTIAAEQGWSCFPEQFTPYHLEPYTSTEDLNLLSLTVSKHNPQIVEHCQVIQASDYSLKLNNSAYSSHTFKIDDNTICKTIDGSEWCLPSTSNLYGPSIGDLDTALTEEGFGGEIKKGTNNIYFFRLHKELKFATNPATQLPYTSHEVLQAVFNNDDIVSVHNSSNNIFEQTYTQSELDSGNIVELQIGSMTGSQMSDLDNYPDGFVTADGCDAADKYPAYHIYKVVAKEGVCIEYDLSRYFEEINPQIYGCTDAAAVNYDPAANVLIPGSCQYDFGVDDPTCQTVVTTEVVQTVEDHGCLQSWDVSIGVAHCDHSLNNTIQGTSGTVTISIGYAGLDSNNDFVEVGTSDPIDPCADDITTEYGTHLIDNIELAVDYNPDKLPVITQGGHEVLANFTNDHGTITSTVTNPGYYQITVTVTIIYDGIEYISTYYSLIFYANPIIDGCTDPFASNFDINATCDDGSCIPAIYGCMQGTMYNYDPTANIQQTNYYDPTDPCVPINGGCIDPNAVNYAEPLPGNEFDSVNTDDGSCYYCPSSLSGFTFSGTYTSQTNNLVYTLPVITGGTNYIGGDVTQAYDATITRLRIVFYNNSIQTPPYAGTWEAFLAAVAVDYPIFQYASVPANSALVFDSDIHPELLAYQGSTVTFPGLLIKADYVDVWPFHPANEYQSWLVTGCDTVNAYGNTLKYWFNGGNCDVSISDACTEVPVISDCTDSTALNYEPTANIDDGSCIEKVFGCTDNETPANNYNAEANTDDGSCTYDYGCTDSTMFNYDSTAVVSDGSCIPEIFGCTDATATNYNPITYNEADPSTYDGVNTAVGDDVACDTTNYIDINGNFTTTGVSGCCYTGCTDPQATPGNYNSNADLAGDCEYQGCTDEAADNYNLQSLPGSQYNAQLPNSCVYYGCTDENAENYTFITSQVENPVQIGEAYGGGIVFDISPSGMAYIVATEDVGSQIFNPGEDNEYATATWWLEPNAECPSTTYDPPSINHTCAADYIGGVENLILNPVTQTLSDDEIEYMNSVILACGDCQDVEQPSYSAGYVAHDYIAYASDGGGGTYEDWYLPSHYQLKLIDDAHTANIINVPNWQIGIQAGFWSCSEFNDQLVDIANQDDNIGGRMAWIWDPNHQEFYAALKNIKHRVRPIRKVQLPVDTSEIIPTNDDDTCLYTGCSDLTASNTFPLIQNGTLVAGVDYQVAAGGAAGVYDLTTTPLTNFVDDGSCIFNGCTLSWSDNYNANATDNDGLCYKIGCTESWADNYDPNATIDDRSCYKDGCQNPLAVAPAGSGYIGDEALAYMTLYGNLVTATELGAATYDATANTVSYAASTTHTVDTAGCVITGCTDATAFNYNANATSGNPNAADCEAVGLGCTNPDALNYSQDHNTEDGSCCILDASYSEVVNLTPTAANQNILNAIFVTDWNCTSSGGGYGVNVYLQPQVYDLYLGPTTYEFKFRSYKGDGTEVWNSGDWTDVFELYRYVQTGFTDATHRYFVDFSDSGNEAVMFEFELRWYNTNTPADACTHTMEFGAPTTDTSGADCAAVTGCTDPLYLQYNSAANVHNQANCTTLIVEGCTDNAFTGYDAAANVHVPEMCGLAILLGCDEGGAAVGTYTVSDVDYTTEGWYTNALGLYNISGTTEAGTGTLPALNFNPDATTEGTGANECVPIVFGCTDNTAANYNAAANINIGCCYNATPAAAGENAPFPEVTGGSVTENQSEFVTQYVTRVESCESITPDYVSGLPSTKLRVQFPDIESSDLPDKMRGFFSIVTSISIETLDAAGNVLDTKVSLTYADISGDNYVDLNTFNEQYARTDNTLAWDESTNIYNLNLGGHMGKLNNGYTTGSETAFSGTASENGRLRFNYSFNKAVDLGANIAGTVLEGATDTEINNIIANNNLSAYGCDEVQELYIAPTQFCKTVWGCMDTAFANFNSAATFHDPSLCLTSALFGCPDGGNLNQCAGANNFGNLTPIPSSLIDNDQHCTEEFDTHLQSLLTDQNFTGYNAIISSSCVNGQYYNSSGTLMPENSNTYPAPFVMWPLDHYLPCWGEAATCLQEVVGCTDETYIEAFDFETNMSTVNADGYTVYTIIPLDPAVNSPDNSLCLNRIAYGCTDSNYTEYDSLANVDDGSCSTSLIPGCTNPAYLEYDAAANTDDGSCETLIVEGCTQPLYLEYNPLANVDDNSCVTLIAVGCTDPLYMEYEEWANTDDGSCITLIVNGCMDPAYLEYNENANVDNGTCETVAIYGCMNPNAFNYNFDANVDDGSCEANIYGCTNVSAINYNANANIDDGSCVDKVEGCMDPTAFNYDETATVDDGSCVAVVNGCTDNGNLNLNGAGVIYSGTYAYTGPSGNIYNYTSDTGLVTVTDSGSVELTDEALGYANNYLQNTGAFNYNPSANIDDGNCIPVIDGCTVVGNVNYDQDANTEDGSCILINTGCIDNGHCTGDNCNGFTSVYPGTAATNYDPSANTNDGSCLYTTGCTDVSATNYTAAAVISDGSCTYCPSNAETVDQLTFTYTKPTTAISADGQISVDSNILNIFEPWLASAGSFGATNLSWYKLEEDNITWTLTYSGAFTASASSNLKVGTYKLVINEGGADTPAFTTNYATCIYEVMLTLSHDGVGCMDENAINYDASAEEEDGSCLYEGCTDPNSSNYDPEATQDDGSCIYISGCTDGVTPACNYNSEANYDDGSCVYAGQYRDCDGNCINELSPETLESFPALEGFCSEEVEVDCTDTNAIVFRQVTNESVISQRGSSSARSVKKVTPEPLIATDDGMCVYHNECVPEDIHQILDALNDTIIDHGKQVLTKLRTGMLMPTDEEILWKLMLVEYVVSKVGLEEVYNCQSYSEYGSVDIEMYEEGGSNYLDKFLIFAYKHGDSHFAKIKNYRASEAFIKNNKSRQ